MILDIREVQAMQQTSATISHDARTAQGYTGAEPALKKAAQAVFREIFPGINLDPRDFTVSCIAYEGDTNAYRLVFRAYWTPSMMDVELEGGTHDGRVHHLQFPHNTVTIPTDMQSSLRDPEKYELAGYDTDTRRFVFRLLQKVA